MSDDPELSEALIQQKRPRVYYLLFSVWALVAALLIYSTAEPGAKGIGGTQTIRIGKDNPTVSDELCNQT